MWWFCPHAAAYLPSPQTKTTATRSPQHIYSTGPWKRQEAYRPPEPRRSHRQEKPSQVRGCACVDVRMCVCACVCVCILFCLRHLCLCLHVLCAARLRHNTFCRPHCRVGDDVFSLATMDFVPSLAINASMRTCTHSPCRCLALPPMLGSDKSGKDESLHHPSARHPKQKSHATAAAAAAAAAAAVFLLLQPMACDTPWSTDCATLPTISLVRNAKLF